MALSTYSELQAAVASFLNRSDLTASIPDFIALAEADINSHFELRTIESDQLLSTTAGSRYVQLPNGFREQKNLWINYVNGRSDPLRFTLPELLITSTSPGTPVLWCIDGGTIAFDCPADAVYSLTLRMIGSSVLSDGNPTNLILANYPNVYLYGALKEAAPFLRDSEMMQTWEAKYADAIFKAKFKEGRDKSLTTLSTELSYVGRMKDYGFDIIRGS